ncbi:MAG: RidA family protein [Thermoguttaceae bacterium]|jgi:enamine deaminase RidA (YjgF/YER057c/UK114 family)|nr:RidA family protein [Thermoguttaceae bacterium]
MIWRFLTAALLAAWILELTHCPAAEESAEPAASGTLEPSIEYVPLDAPEGMSQAVIVQGGPVVYTRQLLPLDPAGKLVGENAVDEQIEQVLSNLDTVLKDCGSGLDKLVRLNVYALAPTTVTRVRELLSKRLAPSVRPAISPVQTPLPHRGALVALDAVAVGSDRDKGVNRKRCEAVSGEAGLADAAVLPAGGIAYLSGVPDDGGLTESAVVRSMSTLMRTLGHLKLSPEQVAHVKIFLRPMDSADEVLRKVQKFFPDQMMPPVVFVEWLAAVPIEIEMVAQLPLSDESDEPVEFFTPPEFRPSHTFSRVALLKTDRQIYISGQYAREPSRGEPQAIFVFEQLQEILDKTGSDMRHLVKATYYVSDDDAARWVDRTRPNVFDPDRPPAASKVMVHAVGMEGRTMTIDMIAVESGK